MSTPSTHPVAVSPVEAAALLRITETTFYRHVAPHVRSGAIQSIKLGRCRRILVVSLLAWVERQSKGG